MTFRQLYMEGCRRLKSAGVPDAENDAWLLLSYICKMSRALYYTKSLEEAGKEEADQYLACIGQRCTRKPLQQITGEQEFMGLSFRVTEDVLVPRQDSETLVEEVLKDLPVCNANPLTILDLCTGSGCLGLSLMAFLENRKIPARLLCTDLSKAALRVAMQNRDRVLSKEWGANVFFSEGDLFQAVEKAKRTAVFSEDPESPGAAAPLFDIMISNPPYIATAEVEKLMPEVRDFEPRMALDGMEDGLFFYRRIAREALPFLKKNGRIYLEIGYDQGKAVSQLLKENEWESVTVIRDLAGCDRVVKGIK